MRANHPDSGRTLPARTPILTGTTKYLIGRWLFASSIQDRSPLLAASLTDAAYLDMCRTMYLPWPG